MRTKKVYKHFKSQLFTNLTQHMVCNLIGQFKKKFHALKHSDWFIQSALTYVRILEEWREKDWWWVLRSVIIITSQSQFFEL